eukprot:MONOS_1895.1-p1 / transcript=MONOS_1895.1 / gene=MONOS_1895 / organism=Monocercomonoides_exilis_PA203 / gene_product=unspecified product / transcript_product=unspecified product / location=Mono_scaffold00036:78510-79753(+) / protein_length=394 / sequence_SO=supercontig / SO=protein_coding / is_pseudo=false
MNRDEFKSVFTKELFDKIYQMIEEKTLSWRNAILLLKHIGYWKTMKNVNADGFNRSLLYERFEEMIIKEEEKKEEKNERLLVDLCECYLLLKEYPSLEFILIFVPFLLKAALKKEENEETQKEVEIALLALSNINEYSKMKQELYLNVIKEIIQYQQKHRNLTKLAYQSAWRFLIYRLSNDESLEEVLVNELHLAREAARELEELTRNMDWNRKKEEEMSKEEAKEKLLLIRWLVTADDYLSYCQLWNEEFVELIGSVAQIFKAAKNNSSAICNWSISFLRVAAESRVVKVDDLLKGKAIDVVFEELYQPALEDRNVCNCLDTVLAITGRLEEKTDNEMEEVKRKEISRKVFEKMEEEGYEDTTTSFYETIDFLNNEYYYVLSLNVSDYFVNI